jgi:hypothetical protein
LAATRTARDEKLADANLTSVERIVLDIIFGIEGESRLNREFDDWGTYYKYVYVASRVPKLTAMHADVNRVLAQVKTTARAPFQICYFKAGDRHYRYAEFPTEVSLETVRTAWVKSGMRALQIEFRRRFKKPHQRRS